MSAGWRTKRTCRVTLIYLLDENGASLHLVARRPGSNADHPAAAIAIELETEPAAWPVDEVLVNRIAPSPSRTWLELFPDLPDGMLGQAARSQARLVPIVRQGQEKPVGVFIAALNPYREFDSFYGGFLDLAAGQIAASITNAQAYEAEKRRARRAWPSWIAPRRLSSAT